MGSVAKGIGKVVGSVGKAVGGLFGSGGLGSVIGTALGSPVLGSVLGAGIGLLGQSSQERAIREAANRAGSAQEAAALLQQEFARSQLGAQQERSRQIDEAVASIFGIPRGGMLTSPFGTGMFGITPSGEIFGGSQLSPQLQEIATGLQGMLTPLLTGGVSGPSSEAFRLMTQLAQPGIEQERLALENRLLQQGLLGLDVGGRGQPQQRAFEEAVRQAETGRSLQALEFGENLLQGRLGRLFDVLGAADPLTALIGNALLQGRGQELTGVGIQAGVPVNIGGLDIGAEALAQAGATRAQGSLAASQLRGQFINSLTQSLPQITGSGLFTDVLAPLARGVNVFGAGGGRGSFGPVPIEAYVP